MSTFSETAGLGSDPRAVERRRDSAARGGAILAGAPARALRPQRIPAAALPQERGGVVVLEGDWVSKANQAACAWVPRMGF